MVFIQPSERELRIASGYGHFDEGQGIVARISPMGQVNFQKRNTHNQGQLFERESMVFNGLRGAGGSLTGELI